MRLATPSTTTAKLIFRVAATWGILALTPILFFPNRIGNPVPRPLTEPEYFHGFLALSLLFAILFLVIASNPIRYRPMMPIAILQKLVYPLAIFGLLSTHRAPPTKSFYAGTEFLLALLFILALLKTPKRSKSDIDT
jgi:hypothetical protein